jgi:hypothetical protein
MNRSSLPVFLYVLVTTFVTLHLLFASADHVLHSFSHSDIHSEHDYSERQGATNIEAKKKATDRERFASRGTRNIIPSRPAVLNREASADHSDHIVCLSSVKLRI